MSTRNHRPNILFFFTDQQRWDSVGVYGNPMELTPNLDRMAAEGIRFKYAFTPQPVCGPARACIQTGKYAAANGVFRNHVPLPHNQPLLARYFTQAGYEVGYIGKFHLSSVREDPVPRAERAGYDGFWEAADTLEFTSRPYQGHIFDAEDIPVEFREQYRADFLTDRAIRFLEMSRDQPFFLFLSYIEPHHQNDMKRYMAPNGYADRYANPWVPLDLRDRPGDWYRELPDYYGCIARLDECLGRVLDVLCSLGQLEDTVIVFTSDHGSHFRTRNSEYKRSCHEASIRIPMVLRGPMLNHGQVINELASLIDLPPTLLDLAGIRPPDTFMGRSMLPLVQGRTDGWPKEIFVQISEAEVGRAIRTQRWKYSVYAPDKHPGQDPASDTYVERYLYDLYADPHESVNLVGRGGYYRDIADDLMARLKSRMVGAGEQKPMIQKARYYA
jgi:arylsulfatase A-like enzyme